MDITNIADKIESALTLIGNCRGGTDKAKNRVPGR